MAWQARSVPQGWYEANLDSFRVHRREMCGGVTKKRALRSNKETDKGKKIVALANSLTKKAPYKGLGADSGEKHEPAGDIDTAAVDSLKRLPPTGRLEKRHQLPQRKSPEARLRPYQNTR